MSAPAQEVVDEKWRSVGTPIANGNDIADADGLVVSWPLPSTDMVNSTSW